MNDEIRRQVEQIKREWDDMAKEHERISAVFGQLAKAAEDMHRTAIEGISLSDAVDRLRLELLKDKEPGSYYYAWQCNIAACFFDVMQHNTDSTNNGKFSLPELHNVSMKAAESFLDLLCLPNNSNIESTK